MTRAMRRRYILPIAATLVLLARCAAPPPPPAPAPPPPPARPAPPPPATDWRDLPLAPGTWRYQPDPKGGAAIFGAPKPEVQESAPLTIRCLRDRRAIEISTPAGTPTSTITVRTSFGDFPLPVSVSIGEHQMVTGVLAASDRHLDMMAYSRGRFMLEQPGREALIVPAWPEFARVIEDCRE